MKGLADPGSTKMKKKTQLSLAQALGNLSGTEFEKLVGLKVFFRKKIRRSRARKEKKHGTVIGFSGGRVYVRTDDGLRHSRDPRGVWYVPAKKSPANLCGTEPENLLGRGVSFEVSCHNWTGTRLKKTETKTGTVIELSKVPGFVIIQDDRGGLYSRDLSQLRANFPDDTREHSKTTSNSNNFSGSASPVPEVIV